MDDWGGFTEDLGTPFDAGIATERPDVGSGDQEIQFAEILKGELIPRLVERRPTALRRLRSKAGSPADPEALARLLVSGRMAEARAAITSRLASGASANDVMFGDIAPAARRLGDFWRQDVCDFADVTIATGALRAILRDVLADEANFRKSGAPALMIATAPGETHELGGDIAAAVFRRAGWRTRRCASEDVRSRIESEWFDVAAFSLSCDRFADSLAGVIGETRKASRNRRIAILVGGPVFASRPGLGRGLGADFCAADAELAPQYPSTIQQMLRL
jgi:methanogenic corrinoid protein MtbC1